MDLQYLKKIGLYVLTAVLSVLLILYIAYHMELSFHSSVETVMATEVTERQTVEVSAYLMRKETVLYATNDGSVRYLYGDGEHLQSGTAVAGIYEGDDVRDAVAALDSKINVLKDSMSGSQTASDTSTIDAKISALRLEMRRLVEEGDYDAVLNCQNDLLSLLNKRQIITKNTTDFNEQIAALEAEREALLAGQEELLETVTLPQAGYFYRDIDGYESTFSSANIDQLTFSDFHEMLNSGTDTIAEAGYPIGKVMTDHRWYLVCEVEESQIAKAKVGSSYTVIFPHDGNTSLTMTLYREVEEPDYNKKLLVFMCSRVPADFSFHRSQTVEIVCAEYEGYRVPVSAVRMLDGVEGVYVLNGAMVEFREIKTLYEGDGYFILEPRDYNDEEQRNRVGLYDKIIVKGKDLYDGKIIS